MNLQDDKVKNQATITDEINDSLEAPREKLANESLNTLGGPQRLPRSTFPSGIVKVNHQDQSPPLLLETTARFKLETQTQNIGGSVSKGKLSSLIISSEIHVTKEKEIPGKEEEKNRMEEDAKDLPNANEVLPRRKLLRHFIGTHLGFLPWENKSISKIFLMKNSH